MESPTDKIGSTRRNQNRSDQRRPVIISVPEAVQSDSVAEGASICPPSRPPSRKGHRKSRRNFRKHFARAFFPVLFMADRVSTSVADRLFTQLWLRDNDKTGVADYALESAGAEIISTNGAQPWPTDPSFLEAALRPYPKSNGPRQLLQVGMAPGECWAFRGCKGEAVIRLVSAIRITSVTVEHISKNVSPTGSITSAPREFEILRLQDNDGLEEVLGRFNYQTSSPSLQTFHLPVPSATTTLMRFRVLSNHGHPAYTCVYRLRVHGDLPTAGSGEFENSDKAY